MGTIVSAGAMSGLQQRLWQPQDGATIGVADLQRACATVHADARHHVPAGPQVERVGREDGGDAAAWLPDVEPRLARVVDFEAKGDVAVPRVMARCRRSVTERSIIVEHVRRPGRSAMGRIGCRLEHRSLTEARQATSMRVMSRNGRVCQLQMPFSASEATRHADVPGRLPWNVTTTAAEPPRELSP